MMNDDDFITHTIARVDGMLAGEREDERAQLYQSDEYQQWSDELDEEDARYWLEHCPEHACELVDGWCALCVQDERRNDL